MVQAVIEMPVEESFDAPTLQWEPCSEAHAAADLGLCDGCGWPVHDHDGSAATGAVVIRVPERLPLRRAS